MPYIGNTIRAADDYRLIDDISSSFNGSTTSFALQVAGSAPVPFPKSPQQVLISVNGVIQEPDPTGASGFNLVGTNIVFSSAPTNGHAFFGIIYATADYLNSGGNFPSGSTGSPSLTFIGDEDTGIYRKSSGSVGFVSNSTEIANTDSNGITISSGNLILGDSSGSSDDRIKLGASGDLEIYHDGSHSRLDETGTGNLMIQSNNAVFIKKGTSENIATFNADGNVELYYDNSKKLETTSGGAKIYGDLRINDNEYIYLGDGTDLQITVGSNNDGVINQVNGDLKFQRAGSGKFTIKSTGTHFSDDAFWTDSQKAIFGDGSDLQIYHDGTNSRIHSASHNMFIRTGGIFGVFNGAGSEDMFKATVDGAVELFFDNSKKFETTSGGVSVTGQLTIPDGSATGNRLAIGDSQDLVLYHDGTHSYIYSDNGELKNRAAIWKAVNEANSEKMIVATENGSVDLYYDDSKKFETTSYGNLSAGQVRVSSSNATTVAFSVGDAGTGFYNSGSNAIGYSANGTQRWNINSAGDLRLNDNVKLRFGGDNDMNIYHLQGANSYITNTANNLYIQTNNAVHLGSIDSNGSNVETSGKFIRNGAVELYYDDSKKFETTSGGIDVTGRVTTDDLTVQKASGNLSVMVTADNGLGTFEIGGSTGAFIDFKSPSSDDFDLRIGTSGTAGYILAAGTGIISIQGHPTPSADNTYDLGTTSLRWRNIYTGDLNLSNKGSSNDVDGTWGSYTIQEGAEDLFLMNKRSGKKYKFNLTEVS